MKHGAYTVSDLAPGMVRLSCAKCGRAGRYRRETLLRRFGPDAALHDVQVAIAACERRANFSDPCQAKFEPRAER